MSEDAVETRPPTPWIVWFIVGAIGVAYVAFLLAPPATQEAIELAFALIPQRLHPDSPYRFDHWYEAAGPIFGHVFLHVAWWHAAINGFFFFLTARRPAARLGPWRFLALFFSAAASGALVFLALNWNAQGVGVGASGAVCGVFSAYYLSVWPTWRQSLADPRVRDQFGMIFLLNVVVMAVAAAFFSVPIAWQAHLGGFIGGALAWIALAPGQREAWR